MVLYRSGLGVPRIYKTHFFSIFRTGRHGVESCSEPTPVNGHVLDLIHWWGVRLEYGMHLFSIDSVAQFRTKRRLDPRIIIEQLMQIFWRNPWRKLAREMSEVRSWSTLERSIFHEMVYKDQSLVQSSVEYYSSSNSYIHNEVLCKLPISL